jgi:hypothetical protein
MLLRTSFGPIPDIPLMQFHVSVANLTYILLGGFTVFVSNQTRAKHSSYQPLMPWLE